MRNKSRQKGNQTVEFALISLLLFALIFAVIEFGEILYVWNALAETTRRGARLASVCPYNSPKPGQVALFDVPSGNATSSFMIPDFTASNISFSYLNLLGGKTTTQTLMNFVQTNIIKYSFTLYIPVWNSTVTAPNFTTTMYAESLGTMPTFPPVSGVAIPTPPSCN